MDINQTRDQIINQFSKKFNIEEIEKAIELADSKTLPAGIPVDTMTERTYEQQTSALSSFKGPPEGGRGLTEIEMAAMKQFSTNYYRKHPKASQREVKRAMQRHFKVQIVRS